jgi:hypothetical protein
VCIISRGWSHFFRLIHYLAVASIETHPEQGQEKEFERGNKKLVLVTKLSLNKKTNRIKKGAQRRGKDKNCEKGVNLCGIAVFCCEQRLT